MTHCEIPYPGMSNQDVLERGKGKNRKRYPIAQEHGADRSSFSIVPCSCHGLPNGQAAHVPGLCLRCHDGMLERQTGQPAHGWAAHCVSAGRAICGGGAGGGIGLPAHEKRFLHLSIQTVAENLAKADAVRAGWKAEEINKGEHYRHMEEKGVIDCINMDFT